MKFFNPKEEVVDIQLSPYGKRLLAKGELKPVYYAFYDDDILYDGALGGVIEDQNQSHERINDQTPRVHTQGVHESIRSTIGQNLEILDATYQYQTFKEGEHILGSPLGESSLSSSKAPAWDIHFRHNEINNCNSYITSSGGTLRVPQLDSRIEYQTYVSYRDSALLERQKNYMTNTYPWTNESVPMGDGIPPNPGGGEYQIDESHYDFEDNSVIMVKRDGLFIDVREENVDYLRENFDIEVFITDIEGDEEKNTSKLYFINEEETQPLTPANVEYWLDIKVDGQIAEDAYCQLKIPLTKKETLGDSVYGCSDMAETSPHIGLRNFYSQLEDDEEPC